MGFRQIPLSEATAGQLRQFATTVLGLEVAKNSTGQQLLGKIEQAGWNKEHIVAEDEESIAAGEAHGSASRLLNTRKNEKTGRPEVRILIHETEKPGGSDPVFASVNGRGIYIPRAEAVWIDEKYLEVLQHSEELVYPEYDPDKDNGMGGLGEPRRVSAYPFTYA